ncbi:histidine phosphatase family protein [Paenibacillus thalictri]|uniref:Histidine phosphatase family protein n=1 Tax=Paenibacillus thalictri TaxID=2527873 RepID=A0A4Q9DW34_9BACL|nr:histidine phosphatase family protein [Paenibacillus thalictri]TBL79361.1 histidine phosphatase family protein [Paenibacillus thalictri]
MELFLIRHGQSVGNIARDQDLPDSPLTGLGKEQAGRIADYLGDKPITRIISSPLIRALQTAQSLARKISLPIEIWKELYEYRKGAPFIGAAGDEFLAAYSEAAVSDEWLEEGGWKYPGHEDQAAVTRRAAAIVHKFRQCGDNDCIAVFAHGTFNDYLIRELLDIADKPHIQFDQLNTGLNHFVLGRGDIKVRKLNVTEHLNLALQS